MGVLRSNLLRKTLQPGALVLLASLLLGCTTGPIYSFVVYGRSEAPASRWNLWEGVAPFEGWERGVGSPAALTVSIYAFYLSPAASCAAPVPLIDYGGDPLRKEFYGAPTLFSGSPSAGEYHCAVLKVSDNFRFRPDPASIQAATQCEDVEYVYDGYQAAQTGQGSWVTLTGSTTTATGTASSPGADIVTLFATTDPQAAITQRGLVSGQIITLPEPLIVPGEATLFSNFLGAVQVSGGRCTLSGGMALGLL